MSTPTLAQAQAALVLVQDGNTMVSQQNNTLAQFQAQLVALQSYTPVNDIASVTAQIAGITNIIAYLQTGISGQVTVIQSYNAANPGAPLPTS